MAQTNPVLNYGTEVMLGFVGDTITDLYSNVGLLITDIYAYTVEVNQVSEVNAVCTFSMLLGAALCGMAVVKQIIGTYGTGTEGDPDQDPVEIIFRLCKALGIMGMNSWLFTEFLKFSTALGKDVTRVMAGVSGGNVLYDKMLDNINNSSGSPTWLFCNGAIVIAVLLFALSACQRGAELTLNKILLPIFCLDIINPNPEKWKMFIFQYGTGFVSYILQMFCFNMFVILFLHMGSMGMKEFIVLLGWLVLSIKTPSWLEKYIYATGTGRAIGQGASRLGQVIMYMGMRA